MHSEGSASPNARAYFDHAATTPVRDEVVATMLPFFGGFNASSLHAEGRAARAALDRARSTVADLLGARPREIVFTGGGSEADNLAILGVARARNRAGHGRHVVTAATEHHAVLAATALLRDDGFEVSVLPVDDAGRVDPSAFAASLRPDSVLASIMLANNEIGTLQPVPALARIARERGCVFHTDAVQAAGRIPLDVRELGVDLMSLSAHKFYGPKGVGALYVRNGTPLEAQLVGGSQETGLRAGTENVAGIAGFARALLAAVDELPAEAARLARLRDRLEAGIEASLSGVRINARTAPRLPNVSSVAFDGVEAATLLIALDLAGVAVSAGSACAAGSHAPSHVIAALDAPRWVEAGTIRFSLGRLTQAADVERLLALLRGVIASLRDEGPDMGTSHSGSLASLAEVRS